METQELVVGNQSVINVVMTEMITDLDEVVVIGYGTMRKVTFPGQSHPLDQTPLRTSSLQTRSGTTR